MIKEDNLIINAENNNARHITMFYKGKKIEHLFTKLEGSIKYIVKDDQDLVNELKDAFND